MILSTCQGLAWSGVTLNLLVAGIVGAKFAPTPFWSTLTNAMAIIGAAVATIPAAFLAKRIGRKKSFIFAALNSAMGSFAMAYFIAIENFFLICFAIFFLGIWTIFTYQYRFAAVESVSPENAGKAVSLVLLGGLAAGFLGPEIGKRAKDWLGYGEYSGPYILLGGIFLGVALIFCFYQDKKTAESPSRTTPKERPLWEIIKHPYFITSFMSAGIGFGGMLLIMTATPLSMYKIDSFTLEKTTLVLQSHIIAMFLPSLFTGTLIQRWGIYKVLLVGNGFMLICSMVAIIDQDFIHYWLALLCLGIGWNFLFIGGTALLTRCYKPVEAFKIQAINDFGIFGIQIIAAFSAGAIIFNTSWTILQLIVLPLFIILFLRLLLTYRSFVAH